MFGRTIECGTVGGGTLQLIPIRADHLVALTGWLNDAEVTRHMDAPFARTLEMEQEWYRQGSVDPNVYRWSIVYGDRHVGQAGINDIHWINRVGSVTVLIGDSGCWGRGLGTAVFRAQAFAEDLRTYFMSCGECISIPKLKSVTSQSQTL